MLSNFIIPWWGKYAVGAALIASVYGYAYVQGLKSGTVQIVEYNTRVIEKQGKVTEKIITKYIKIKEKQKQESEVVTNEGKQYAIQFHDAYHFNNEFVRLYDQSVKGSIPPLPDRERGEPSSISVPEVLSVSINNTLAGREWKLRAETCENWTKEQEELNN